MGEKCIERDVFESEMKSLGIQITPGVVPRTYLILAEVLRWLRLSGHGEVRLAAIEHRLSPKLRVDSVVTVREIDNSS
jgi:hypothetical protein